MGVMKDVLIDIRNGHSERCAYHMAERQGDSACICGIDEWVRRHEQEEYGRLLIREQQMRYEMPEEWRAA
jgi:hypothetical protein